MGLMLFLLVFVLVRIRPTLQQQGSSEDINHILDKLIQQTNNTNPITNGESSEIMEPYFPIPIDPEVDPGNDSNIYYFKTYMAPRIKFKSNSEMLNVVSRSNTTVKNIEVDTRSDAMSEDTLIPGTQKNGFVDEEEKAQVRSSPNTGETVTPQYGEINNNFNVLEDLLQKDISKKPTTEPSPYGHVPAKPLSLLHDYPEIVIDHIRYNSDEKDGSEQPNNIKGIKKKPGSSGKTIYHTIEPLVAQDNDIKTKADVKEIVEKVIQDSLAKNMAKGDSNKQNILLEKILQRLPEKDQQDNPAQIDSRAALPYALPLSSLPTNEVGQIGLLSSYLQNLQRNVVSRLSTTFVRAPVLTQAGAWPSHRHILMSPYLSGGLLGLTRPEALKRTRLALLPRVAPRYMYRPAVPVYYGLYKK